MFPGVFVEEVPSGVRSIEGVATSTAAFVDVFPHGPLDRAVQVLSAADAQRAFGGAEPASAASVGIRQFFRNGGGVAYVVRVAAPTAAALLGDRDARSGLYALDEVDLFNLLCLPGAADLPPAESRAVYAAAAAYCGERRALLVIDPPAGIAVPATMQSWVGDGGDLRHANAAVYFPRLRAEGGRTVAASGAIAGLYARTDATRGVWTAPAGAEALLRGVAGPARAVTDDESAALNALGINPLREFPDTGTMAWGARTLSDDEDWRYVPIRRFALFLEESVYRGLTWVVAEPNGEPLWAEVRRRVGAFLEDLFRRGALQGRTPAEAYFVRCGAETTTQDDIDAGVVHVVVGFAPLRPAEFVVVTVRRRLNGAPSA